VQLSRLLRRRFALLTSLMMLAAALMPTLAHAFDTADGVRWTEICTPHGIKKVAVPQADGASKQLPTSLSGALDHCPFCSLGSHSPALPASPLRLSTPDAARHENAELFYPAPHTSLVWCAAQPRAPPVRS